LKKLIFSVVYVSQTMGLNTLLENGSFYRATACNATYGISVGKLFYCLSVRPSVKRVNCDKTSETCANILKAHERSFILVF